MNQEIERKFLVNGNFKKETYAFLKIIQGYLSSVPERTVRIRIEGQRGYITVKGKSNESGISRFEWEKEIPVQDARKLLTLCESGRIDKTRYLIRYGEHTFEVDEFHGENEGLILAEIELADENEGFEKPAWLDREVTGDLRYYNAMLSKNPYKNW